MRSAVLRRASQSSASRSAVTAPSNKLRASRGFPQRDATRGKSRPHRRQQRPRWEAGLNETLKDEQRGWGRHVAIVGQDCAFVVESPLVQRQGSLQRGKDLRASGMASKTIDVG